MDPSSLQSTPSLQEDEWDTDGFVIPSLGIGDPNKSEADASVAENSKQSSFKAKKEEKIYLGPHGAPPCQAKLLEVVNPSGRKHRFRQKLKEADKRISGSGRENKLDNLRDLGGGGIMPVNVSKGSARDWLDPHCQESQFERSYSH